MEKKKRGCCGTLLIVLIIFVAVGVIGYFVTGGRRSRTEEAGQTAPTVAPPAFEETEEAPISEEPSLSPAPGETSESSSSGTFERADGDDASDDAGLSEGGEAPSQEGDSPSVVPETLVTPSFKEAMDSYEAFFDEYIAFMEKIDESDDPVSMLSESASYMERYADTMEKMDEIDEDELSDADLAYYLEVHNRIMKKLSEADI